MIFRAMWPITDQQRPFLELCADAATEIPTLLAQAHAKPTAAGRYTVAQSALVPGSGRTTPWVLLYECPALAVPARPYHRTTHTKENAA